MKPPKEPVLPFVEMPRPLQESGVIGKGGAAGFLGKAYDPYRLYQDPDQADQARRSLAAQGSAAGAAEGSLRTAEGHQRLDAGSGKGAEALTPSTSITARRSTWCSRAKRAMRSISSKEPDKVRERYGRTTFGQGLLLSRRLIEAGTRFVQMNWPSVANGNPEVDSWDTHAANFGPLKNLHCPMLDRGLSALLEDMDAARHVEGDAGGGDRRIRPLAAPRREHVRQLQRARWPRSLAVLL